MWKTGLTSISFRKLSPGEIIDLTVRAGLDGIEWGSDGHLLPGKTREAADIAAATRAAGLEVLSVGSYWRAGETEAGDGSAELALCQAMGTKMLRVWAGHAGSLAAEGEARARTVAALQKLCDMASPLGITVATEYHANTLTDNLPSALRMLREVGRENLRSYWQPVVWDTDDANASALAALLPQAANIHVFAWTPEGKSIRRHPLADAEGPWAQYIALLRDYDAAHPGTDRCFMLEFVKDDDPANCVTDAAVLNRWIKG